MLWHSGLSFDPSFVWNKLVYIGSKEHRKETKKKDSRLFQRRTQRRSQANIPSMRRT
jgi:hypothetical protein